MRIRYISIIYGSISEKNEHVLRRCKDKAEFFVLFMCVSFYLPSWYLVLCSETFQSILTSVIRLGTVNRVSLHGLFSTLLSKKTLTTYCNKNNKEWRGG